MTPKPRPIYRSLTFWAGALVLLFIAWAWRDSMQMETYIRRSGYAAKNLWGYIVLEKTLTIFRDTTERTLISPTSPFDAAPLPPPMILRGGGDTSGYELPELGLFHVWMRGNVGILPQDTLILLIPRWLLLLTAALPWTALLLWRAWRQRCAMKALTTPAPYPDPSS